MWITSSLDLIQTPTVVALGNFDGIHRGHRRVIDPVVSAEALSLTPSRSDRAAKPHPPGIPTVATFHPHPQEFFSGKRRLLLTPLPEKADVLNGIGVVQLVRIPFTAELAALDPADFVEQVLVNRLHAIRISVGEDFCFGRNRSGTAADLQAIARPLGIEVMIVPLHREGGDRISSSAIRSALESGQLNQANQLLGRPYTLQGKVITGQKLGRTLGFPTANLHLPPEKFLPRFGVYAVTVAGDLEGTGDRLQRRPGVMNLGIRPTVDGQELRAEVHVLDWQGDLYGKSLSLHLHAFLRPEQKFESLDHLKTQIQTDCDQARSHLTHLNQPLPQ